MANGGKFMLLIYLIVSRFGQKNEENIIVYYAYTQG